MKPINCWRGIDVDTFTLMPAGGRSLTIPNQAISIKIAVDRFSAPSIQERLKGYYEEEGLELPNFDRLDKVERLQYLADAKENLFHAKKAANDAVDNFEAKANAEADAKAKSEADAKAKPEAANKSIPSTSKDNSL